MVGKWLSNLAVLVFILSAMTAMAAVMQLVRAEDTTLRLGTLVPTIWWMGLPVLAISAALAVLFECTPALRGSLGNVVFVLLWLGALIAGLAGSIDEKTGLVRPAADLHSFSRPMDSIQQQVLAADPQASVRSGLVMAGPDFEGTFVWDGFSWKVGIVLERLRWVGLALVLALAAAIPFDRFDPARLRPQPERTGRQARRRRKLEATRHEPERPADAPVATAAVLTPLAAPARRGRPLGVLVAELKLMLKGQSPFWYAGALGLSLACLLVPAGRAQQYLSLAVWVWPLAVWSQMGTRERRFNTEQILFAVPRPSLRRLPALWLAGVLVAVVAGSGAWLRLALMGETASLPAWFVGALFVPALALAAGVWVGNSRAFEAVYLLLCYLGLMEGVPALNFVGASAEGLAMGMPVVYLAITAGLVALAIVGANRRKG